MFATYEVDHLNRHQTDPEWMVTRDDFDRRLKTLIEIDQRRSFMDEQQLLAMKPEFDRFPDRFAPPLFGRSGACVGLLQGGERRETENIAQAMCGGFVRSLQAFIGTGVWTDGEVLNPTPRSDHSVGRGLHSPPSIPGYSRSKPGISQTSVDLIFHDHARLS